MFGRQRIIQKWLWRHNFHEHNAQASWRRKVSWFILGDNTPSKKKRFLSLHLTLLRTERPIHANQGGNHQNWTCRFEAVISLESVHSTYLSFLVFTVHVLSSLAKHGIGFFPRNSDIKNQRAKSSLTLLCARGLKLGIYRVFQKKVSWFKV